LLIGLVADYDRWGGGKSAAVAYTLIEVSGA
jgi:hypothetical protein